MKNKIMIKREQGGTVVGTHQRQGMGSKNPTSPSMSHQQPDKTWAHDWRFARFVTGSGHAPDRCAHGPALIRSVTTNWWMIRHGLQPSPGSWLYTRPPPLDRTPQRPEGGHGFGPSNPVWSLDLPYPTRILTLSCRDLNDSLGRNNIRRIIKLLIKTLIRR